MNETLAKILKFFSRNIGFFLINFAVLLVLAAFFINSSINNIDVLKNELESSIKEEILTQNNITKTDLELALDYCKNNLQDERCRQISEITNNTMSSQFFDDFKIAKKYVNLIIVSSIILFLIGFLFVYLGVFNFLSTSYKVSVHLTIHNFLAALYFKFIPNFINLALENQKIQEITKNVPKEYINKIVYIILNWIRQPLYKTIKLTIILGIIFLIISVILYFLKKKALKDKSRDK